MLAREEYPIGIHNSRNYSRKYLGIILGIIGEQKELPERKIGHFKSICTQAYILSTHLSSVWVWQQW